MADVVTSEPTAKAEQLNTSEGKEQTNDVPMETQEVAKGAGTVPEVNGSADATTDEQFLSILALIMKQLPPEPAVQDPLRNGMIRHWLTPPVGHLRLMLGDDSISLLDARRCIFYPTQEDMRLRYPRMILSPPAGLEMMEQHPQRKVQAPALTLLYFIHQHSWELVRPLILGGGLQGFAALAVDPNLYVRAQAIEIFHRLSNGYEGVFDWWQKPSPEELPVHQKLFSLVHTPFLRNLIANFEPDVSFPNGSFLCLQLAAFWLSFVRHFWTKDNVLRLSQSTLDAFLTHSNREALPQEERDLAKKLYDDFARWPPLEEMSLNTMRDSSPSSSPSKPPPPANTEALPSADLLKDQGNALFKAGNWEAAAALYTAAIDLAQSPGTSVGPRIAMYYGNRAAAHAKLWEQQQAKGSPLAACLPHAERCIADCDAAVAADPMYLKGFYRKACQQLEVANATEGEPRVASLVSAQSAIALARQLAPEDDAVFELEQRIAKSLSLEQEAREDNCS
eukprot:GGOE01000401.1.p1 GENE.GGOE01000401.1~~GGOE01000401.1.p1  ORF type:complete len:520 (-),score=129.44 GGOE01000401.1:231-1751(-)